MKTFFSSSRTVHQTLDHLARFDEDLLLIFDLPSGKVQRLHRSFLRIDRAAQAALEHLQLGRRDLHGLRVLRRGNDGAKVGVDAPRAQRSHLHPRQDRVALVALGISRERANALEFSKVGLLALAPIRARAIALIAVPRTLAFLAL